MMLKCSATRYRCGHKSSPLVVAESETLVKRDRYEWFGIALVGCGIAYWCNIEEVQAP